MSSHSRALVGTRIRVLPLAATLDDMACARPLSPGPKRRVGDVTAGYTPSDHPNPSSSLHMQQTAPNPTLIPSMGANYAHPQPKEFTPRAWWDRSMASNVNMQAEFRCHSSLATRRLGCPVYRMSSCRHPLPVRTNRQHVATGSSTLPFTGLVTGSPLVDKSRESGRSRFDREGREDGSFVHRR
ncbi:uncharacterized protein B0H64DRAFT_222168 [Chaetomium fimeti]|uniref:Uncharacterized protein n=1 Tax=Chaetomium fimeti TaxID=1854472 RepID=A0AAE0LP57_9PEZI|nr:hypothetical protein B0H64DRAFT_222168 [Chaetomium fimeti]